MNMIFSTKQQNYSQYNQLQNQNGIDFIFEVYEKL